MEQLDAPDGITWQDRRDWFEDRQAHYARGGVRRAYSEQAFALIIDLQAIFCAGAWAATVVLAAAIVESQARLSGRRLGADLPDIDRRELVWLHRLRNKLLHEDPQGPVLTVDDQWARRDLWQGHARRAVEIAFATLYAPVKDEKR